MSKLTLRGGAAALALAALAAPSAHAAPTKAFPYPVVDVSSDGRYLLHVNGDVVDRSGTNGLPQGTLISLDLADHAPIALGTDVTSGSLYVRTLQAPRGTIASIGPDGKSVPASTGKLVQNGAALVFSTTERPARIIKRDLATGTSTVLMTGATLLDASEDGRVITYLRQLPNVGRPAGSTPVDGDPGPATSGQAVGYLVAGGQPHVVSVTKWRERAVGELSGTCPTKVEVDVTTPLDLKVSQRGQAGGSYSLILTTSDQRGGGYPFAATTITRLSATSGATIVSTDGQTTNATISPDPVSGAAGVIVNDKANGYPLANDARIVEPSGAVERLAIPAPEGSTDTAAFFRKALPFNAGAGVAFTATSRAANATWTSIDESLTPGADTTPWTELPRAVDAVDGAGTKIDATWAECEAPPAGTFSEYVGLALKTSGSSAGLFTVTSSPAGRLKAASYRAAITWNGLALWRRSGAADATVRLPWIPAGLPGLKLTIAVTLADGTVLSQSTALRRTR